MGLINFIDLPTSKESDPFSLVIDQDSRSFNNIGDINRNTTLPADFLNAEDEQKSSIILSFQDFLSTQHPIIGKLYFGPVDGKINDKLIAAVKSAENIIADIVKDNKVIGLIWDNNKNKFNTNIEDLGNTLEILSKYKNNTANNSL